MTRRSAVRVVLFERARLVGAWGGVRCAVVDLSATGARLTISAPLPHPPLRLEFAIGDEWFDPAVEVTRVVAGGQVAVTFRDPPADRLHHVIATAQRLAIAAGRTNVRERRSLRQGRAWRR
jgi:hypothetical protein